MNSHFLAAIAAVGLITSSTASAAETRSAAAIPAQSAANQIKHGAVSVSRGSKDSADESNIAGKSGLLTLLFLAGGGIIAAVVVAKSKG